MTDQRPADESQGGSVFVSLVLIATIVLVAVGFAKSVRALVDPERILVTPRPYANGPSKLYIYKEQREDSRKLGGLGQGQTVEFLGDLGNWYQVRAANGAHGVVRKWVTMTVSSRSGRELSSDYRPLRGSYPLFLSGVTLFVLVGVAIVHFNLLALLPSRGRREVANSLRPVHPVATRLISQHELAPQLPSFNHGYDGLVGEVRKRGQIVQVVRTMDRQITLNEKHLTALGQVRRLEDEKLAIVNLRYAQERAFLEHQDQADEINVRAIEREARIAQAKLARTKADQEVAAILNPVPPRPEPPAEERARERAKQRTRSLEEVLLTVKCIDEMANARLAELSQEQRAPFLVAIRKAKDELMEEVGS